MRIGEADKADAKENVRISKEDKANAKERK